MYYFLFFIWLLLLLVWDEVSMYDLFGALKKNKMFWILGTEKDQTSWKSVVYLFQHQLFLISLPLKLNVMIKKKYTVF